MLVWLYVRKFYAELRKGSIDCMRRLCTSDCKFRDLFVDWDGSYWFRCVVTEKPLEQHCQLNDDTFERYNRKCIVVDGYLKWDVIE